MLTGKRAFLLFSVILIMLSSCSHGVLYQKYTSIPNSEWDMKAPVTFKLNVTDTTSYYNVFVNVRNADNYAYSNLYLFIDITSPMHTKERDTLECILADPSGRWMGEGLGDIWDNKILFKRNVRFPKSGEYDITYTQAMREDKLQMIMDVGLTVEELSSSRNTH
jgi:gliding motility-associated lipoprotein GldH